MFVADGFSEEIGRKFELWIWGSNAPNWNSLESTRLLLLRKTDDVRCTSAAPYE